MKENVRKKDKGRYERWGGLDKRQNFSKKVTIEEHKLTQVHLRYKLIVSKINNSCQRSFSKVKNKFRTFLTPPPLCHTSTPYALFTPVTKNYPPPPIHERSFTNVPLMLNLPDL